MIGGGPAGSTAARLLASWGHAVRLIARPAGEARLAESLPPSCRKLFDVIGVSGAIERAGFIRSTGNTVWWDSAEARVERFAEGELGWQVDAHVLDDVMLAQAAAAGASLERRAATDADASPGAGSFVLDCSGRSGILARALGLRHYHEGPKTIALVGLWGREDAWPVPDPTHTLIESYSTGWAWSVPTAAQPEDAAGATRRHIAVMVDPQRSGLARGMPARDVYLAEIAKTEVFRAHTGGAALAGGPWGWDASTYSARQYAGDGFLLVGDAGSFVDPLSSAGVKKALASGWLAAIVAHTCRVRPEMRAHALAFFSAREQEIEQHHARASRRFLAAAASRHPYAFWADRSADVGEDEAPAEAAAVRLALQALQAAPVFQARPGGDVTVEPRAAVSGREIVLEPRLVDAGHPQGIRHVHGVDLVVLLDLAPQVSQVPDLYEAYGRRVAPVPLHDFVYALATAIARGWIVG